MVNPNTFFLLVLIAFISTIRTAVCISCFQCNSTDINHQFLCTENMEDSDSLRPQPCTSINDAAYCVTQIGLHRGGLGVTRYCSSHNLGNYCKYLKRPGDVVEYRTCIYTCDSDGCNGPRELKLFRYLKNLSIIQWFRNLSF
ncbi:U-scoloptoxin(05)-Cw1a-like [Metopolophium dirhodum]|uniref:U-scoloptoxin(05)-Cw1a-like n=1 Tax=Metopolophium dirhodum TaxID=44670 RepID=UPI00298F54D0|nr:U-scoloptoxin(05)-Cw1a-like [Metopolophium dirhodum]